MRTNLQSLRKAAGYKSAREFAEKIGMPVATYTDYEQGRRSFTLERAWEFADVLDCSLDELAGRDFKDPKEQGRQLTPDESSLLDSYRMLTPDRKRLMGEQMDDAAGRSQEQEGYGVSYRTMTA